VNLLHVPFRSSPEAINAVLGKHADVLFDTVSALIGQVQSGSLKALAVTGKDRCRTRARWRSAPRARSLSVRASKTRSMPSPTRPVPAPPLAAAADKIPLDQLKVPKGFNLEQ
jgi:tripartite tricarboxylate transporter family receptor